ncbi:MAG: DUF2730 family protein [Rhodospirillaceae bacterium]|nr:DUF2730 family protein [Rhodospirillaceae bacterium]
MEQYLQIAAIVVGLLNLPIAWFLWSLRKAFASKEEVATLRTKQELLAKQLEGVPSGGDIAKLQVQLAEIHGDHKALSATMEGMKDSMDGVKGSVQLISEHLLNAKVKG